MALYNDIVTEAAVGDVVRCLHAGLHHLTFKQESVVTEICGNNIKVSAGFGTLYDADYFELIRRAPSPEPEQHAVNNEQSPPLVVKDSPDKSQAEVDREWRMKAETVLAQMTGTLEGLRTFFEINDHMKTVEMIDRRIALAEKLLPS